MEKASVPRYYGFRIYLSSSILLFFLVFPFFLIIGFQSVPKFIASKEQSNPDAAKMLDSLTVGLDSIQAFDEQYWDTIVERAIVLGDNLADSIESGNMNVGIRISEDESHESDTEIGNDGPLECCNDLSPGISIASTNMPRPLTDTDLNNELLKNF